MDHYIKVLDLLLRRMAPGEYQTRLLQQRHVNVRLRSREDEKQLFITHFANESYSMDEASNVYEQLVDEVSNWTWLKTRPGIGDCPDDAWRNKINLPILILSLVGKMAEEMLCLNRGEPRCKTEHILTWRNMSLPLGQDLFTCAFLALHDHAQQVERAGFTWPPTLHTDHVGLNALLRKGLPENHQHLYGSSQSFHLSWCSLMNHPEDHKMLDDVSFRVLRQSKVLRTSNARLLSLKDQVRYACLLRLRLYQDLLEPQDQPFLKWLQSPIPELDVLHDIRQLRTFHGARVPQPNGKTCCLDYALTPEYFDGSPDAHYRSLAGERAFLYHCFRRFYADDMAPELRWGFCLYLLIKNVFRGELVQVNGHVGFANFELYQFRKDHVFWNRPCYRAELIRMAINAPMHLGNVSSLETRIAPKNTPKDDINAVLELDRLKQFAGLQDDSKRLQPTPKRNVQDTARESDDYFYVYHFIKRKDDALTPQYQARANKLNQVCRHQALRKDIGIQARALAKALSKSDYLCSRIRGIDCANNEVGCPPEVFATAYRYLRNFRPAAYQGIFQTPNLPVPMLSATFHVAEDFLDIATSLRAIDDAVQFLELERGDRIGHALGLGVQPELHYERKGHRIYLSNQERLDDIVWMLNRGREMGSKIDPDLYGILKKEAEFLLMEIYQSVFSEHGVSRISLTDYFCIMQLRGDDPQRYRTGQFSPLPFMHSPYESFEISHRDKLLQTYRSNPIYGAIHYHYLYDNEVKRCGAETRPVDISDAYIRLMEQLQNRMLRDLGKRGIIVECNPSSNVLIGTFRTYENHPVFRFYRAGLDDHTAECHDEIQVCINTDDLGVFDTSLEFEYALLFRALDEQRNPDGTKRFSTFMILDYLERVRQMSQWSIFPRDEYRYPSKSNR